MIPQELLDKIEELDDGLKKLSGIIREQEQKIRKLKEEKEVCMRQVMRYKMLLDASKAKK